jgi:hypothetical protein
MTTLRKRSSVLGQTTALAMPVSSSMVMNTTPLAEPGRWRTSTTPATDTSLLHGPQGFGGAFGLHEQAGCGIEPHGGETLGAGQAELAREREGPAPEDVRGRAGACTQCRCAAHGEPQREPDGGAPIAGSGAGGRVRRAAFRLHLVQGRRIEAAGEVRVDLGRAQRPRRGSGRGAGSVGGKRTQGRRGRVALERLDVGSQARNQASFGQVSFEMGGGRDGEEGVAIPAGGRKRPEPNPTRT